MAANQPLADAARELLNHINRGGRYFEDFSFTGMSKNMARWCHPLADIYYGNTVGKQFTPAMLRPFLERVIRDYTYVPPPPPPKPSPVIEFTPKTYPVVYPEPQNLEYASAGIDLGQAGNQVRVAPTPDPAALSRFQLPPTPLQEGQYELLSPISSFVFGEGGTGIRVEEVDYGTAEQRNDDAEAPLRDGMRQGRDFFGGRVVTFTINVKPSRGMNEAIDIVDEMAAAWSGDDIRQVAGGYYILRNKRGGRVRRLYGRPRKFAAKSRLSTKGWVPVTCTFECTTHQFYGDQLNSATAVIPASTSSPSRTRWPIRWPLRYLEPVSTATTIMSIRGTRSAWPVVQVKAPNGITDPTLKFGDLGAIPIRGRVDPDNDLIIDTRPWSEGVSLLDGSNVPGMLVNAPPLHRWGLPRGDYLLGLSGNDPSRTASVEVQWYETYANF